ncbi:MAG: transcriptional regulator [Armatimonadota bacterium]
MKRIDPIIHEPARLLVMSLLSGRERVDFYQMLALAKMTAGNLSSHMARLEAAGYVAVAKSFRGKTPHTEYHITGEGREALLAYWHAMDELRILCRPGAPKS